MSRKRAILAGMTDYTGVSLDDIVGHLHGWRDMTHDTISTLRRLRAHVEQQRTLLEYPDAVLHHIDCCCDLLGRYASDFERLLAEAPSGVRKTHLEIIQQIYESSRRGEEDCVGFKQDFIARGLPNEEVRPLLDEIYAESRSMFIDYRDLSNVVPRLRTYVTSSVDGGDVLQLRPTLWGVGIDLKRLWKRVRAWFKRAT